jgi:hypothetical protein
MAIMAPVVDPKADGYNQLRALVALRQVSRSPLSGRGRTAARRIPVSLQQLSESATDFGNAVLTAELSRTLGLLARERPSHIDRSSRQAAREGAELLSRILQGSLALGNRVGASTGLHPSTVGLREFNQAVCALENARLSSATEEDAKAAQLIMSFRKRLIEMSAEGKLPRRGILAQLHSFFQALNGLFFAELRRSHTSPPRDALVRWKV